MIRYFSDEARLIFFYTKNNANAYKLLTLKTIFDFAIE